jgi:hypothetical protein
MYVAASQLAPFAMSAAERTGRGEANWAPAECRRLNNPDPRIPEQLREIYAHFVGILVETLGALDNPNR